ncbi:TPA: hypothetical protein HH295_07140 [Xanthomonas vasicola pv. zeae]|uniref:Uncharacterized protein n=2 Tax=Xanthomonas vasicola TaxID=56459 RepID=A0AAE8F7A8_XANVA|nr:hypothetical protein [Xanthomonas vasicola]AVQ07842.1 hypothetical protein C7V42_15735 [Xanthomonas vasicola pv. vasculorum]AZM72041.1 hypothetical protein CXP37_15755 [Xanthomonas vasicola pv. vasculorum]AZR30247.1 hypothetical protein KWO_006555 [Xanthomonas vasicola pv. musacearum NCPPB 4379]MBV6743984.1 hypothetical protein [Xanthomonas vasicola pv. musacearum NCPPB 2251]MBV6745387.1 hypothetical protein [Xanthomonas vasicola pv. vasculorum NCPPB 890]
MKKIKRLGFNQQLKDRPKIIFYSSLVLVGYVVSHLIDHGTTALIGCVAGIAGHWKATWISKVEVSNANRRETEEFLISNRYSFNKNKNYWEPDIHRLLRFDAQDIMIKKDDDLLLVIGPFYILKKMLSKPQFQ